MTKYEKVLRLKIDESVRITVKKSCVIELNGASIHMSNDDAVLLTRMLNRDLRRIGRDTGLTRDKEENKKQFEVGDIVRLTSNTDLMMTVEKVEKHRDGRDMIHCVWFVGGHVMRDWFQPAMLLRGVSM